MAAARRPGSRPVGDLAPSVLLLVAYVVLTRSAPEAFGLRDEGRATRWILVAAGISGVLAALPGRIALPGLPSAFDPTAAGADFTPVVIVATSLAALAALLVAVAAVRIQLSHRAAPSTRLGVTLLAAALLVETTTPLVLSAVGGDSASIVVSLGVAALLFGAAGVAAGVIVASPWLAPRLNRVRRSVRRGYRRYVDSTP